MKSFALSEKKWKDTKTSWGRNLYPQSNIKGLRKSAKRIAAGRFCKICVFEMLMSDGTDPTFRDALVRIFRRFPEELTKEEFEAAEFSYKVAVAHMESRLMKYHLKKLQERLMR